MPSIFQAGIFNIPGNTRLALTEGGQLKADGRQNNTNIFARAWDCLTRSSEKVEANKAVARQFIAEIREKYGDGVADMASRELKSHLDKGRPLTAHRVSCVLKNADDAANLTWLRDQNLTRVEIRDVRAQFSRDELTLLREGHVSIDVGRQYKEREIPIHPRTLVAYCRDENVVEGSKKELRGGAVSKPYEVQYRHGDQLDTMVFKEARLGEGHGAAATALGIDPHSCMAVRNIATKVVDEALGFNLVPDTRIGMLDGQLGMVMGFATGAPATKQRMVDVTDSSQGQMVLKEQHSLNPEELKDLLDMGGLRIEGDRVFKSESVQVQHDYRDPGLRRELVKLQLLDALTAQGDRHGGNFVIQRGEGGRFTGLSAIDNDQAFGSRIEDPRQLLGDSACRCVDLPPVVDEGIKAAFANLSDDQLRRDLTGLLPKDEIDAAVARLQVIKEYLAGGPPPMVLTGENPDWGSEAVGRALSDPATSYVGRELSRFEGLNTMSYEEAEA